MTLIDLERSRAQAAAMGISLERLERQLMDELEAQHPDLWRVCYPRIYRDYRSGLYCSPKKPAYQMMLIALKMLTGQIGTSELYEFLLASHLVRYRMPMYWLSESIAQAITLTMPPGQINWYEMPMPFEAGVFMVPKGALRHQTDGNVNYVCYARFRAGEQHRSLLVKDKPYGSANGSMILAASVESGYFIHWNIPRDAYGSVVTIPELQRLMGTFSNEHTTAIRMRDNGIKPEDTALGLDVAQFIFSTLMLTTARPDLVTAATLDRRVPAKKGSPQKEFWSPAIIGEHYKVKHEARPSQGGTHASPRFHWVKGFLREQAYGPNQKLRKTLWIEPYTRGAREEERP